MLESQFGIIVIMEAKKDKNGVIIYDLDNSSSETSGTESGDILHNHSDFSVSDSLSSSHSISISSSSSSYFNKKRLVTPFLRKTYEMVSDPKTNSIVSWNSDGSHFIVWNAHKFAAEILPNYFRHNNFSSFVVQLNTYGFKKVVWEKLEFQHQWFQRGKKSWLKRINRRNTRNLPPVQIPLQENQQHQLSHEEQTCEENVEKEIKQLQEENVILAKKLAAIKKQAETPDVRGRKLFLLMAQDFLENKKGLEGEQRERDENNTKDKIPVEKELPNAVLSDANSGSESETRLEKLVEEREDIMIGVEDLIGRIM